MLKTLKLESFGLFKTKAVGNEIGDFESKLKLEINKLTLTAKSNCSARCDQRCQELIKSEVETMESMIRQELIREVEDLNERLSKLRERYFEITAEINYTGKPFIIGSVIDRLTHKGYEAIMRNQREKYN